MNQIYQYVMKQLLKLNKHDQCFGLVKLVKHSPPSLPPLTPSHLHDNDNDNWCFSYEDNHNMTNDFDMFDLNVKPFFLQKKNHKNVPSKQPNTCTPNHTNHPTAQHVKNPITQAPKHPTTDAKHEQNWNEQIVM